MEFLKYEFNFLSQKFCALKNVYRPKQTFFGQTSIEKQPAIGSEHFTVGLFAMILTNKQTKSLMNFH